MPVTGSFADLRRAINQAARAGRGAAAADAIEALKKATLGLAERGFDAGRSPRGASWKAGRSGTSGRLKRSGNLRNSLRIESRPNGFALTARAAATSGSYYGGTHQYGRTIRAKGKKPMRWRSPDGRWHSAMKVRIPARPIAPRSGDLPPAWAAEFERAVVAVLEGK